MGLPFQAYLSFSQLTIHRRLSLLFHFGQNDSRFGIYIFENIDNFIFHLDFPLYIFLWTHFFRLKTLFGYFDLSAIQAPSPPQFWTPPLKSIFSMFQMIWSKKKMFFFWYKKNFLDLKFFSKYVFFFAFFFLFYNECEPNPLPPDKFS